MFVVLNDWELVYHIVADDGCDYDYNCDVEVEVCIAS